MAIIKSDISCTETGPVTFEIKCHARRVATRHLRPGPTIDRLHFFVRISRDMITIGHYIMPCHATPSIQAGRRQATTSSLQQPPPPPPCLVTLCRYQWDYNAAGMASGLRNQEIVY